jgi:nitrogen-specific signal transduction histidine kinase
MTTNPQEAEALQAQLDNLKSGIRQISHDIYNPLGVLRMAAYFLELGKGDDEKKAQYIKTINESIDKIEVHLKTLKALRENPSLSITPPAAPEAK